jgi:hypothetical protein
MNPLASYILPFACVLEDTKAGAQKLEDKAFDEYRAALQIPRKKKKRKKREALLLYRIAQWGKENLYFNEQP